MAIHVTIWDGRLASQRGSSVKSIKLDVLGHDGNPFGVDSAQICVFKETNKVCLRCLLQSQHGMALETQIRLEILCDLTNKPLERQLSDQQLGTLLVLANLSGKRIEPNQIK
ncbi:hypothetical protein M5K25_017362 [Dendrobium thyrsiflorum]|uniref:Uncharacterized protein n=1 Tax=Dendrobium thyrsiflorum TaxID=117978 RepID=A0ABD0UME1_DENTH